MNGYRDSRSQEPKSVGGAVGIEVTRTYPRTPAPDGEERNIQLRNEPCHLSKEVGVPREVDALGTHDRVTEGSRGTAGCWPAPVLRRSGSNDDITNVDLVADRDLPNVPELERLHHSAQAVRQDDRRLAP